MMCEIGRKLKQRKSVSGTKEHEDNVKRNLKKRRKRDKERKRERERGEREGIERQREEREREKGGKERRKRGTKSTLIWWCADLTHFHQSKIVLEK
jgi:hypothetical protein